MRLADAVVPDGTVATNHRKSYLYCTNMRFLERELILAMRPRPLLRLALLAIVLSPLVISMQRDTRSVRPVSKHRGDVSASFDRGESVALFVGVRKFQDDSLEPVRFAVDDAVDLAYAFAIDPHVSLVDPKRVVLALSGTPQKDVSKRRLEALRAAGAMVKSATLTDVLTLLQQQAGTVGRNGLFVVAFATHGFSSEGVPYVLTSTSLFRHPETAISTAKVFDLVATSGAARSLVLVDACRERVSTDVRPGVPDPHSAAPLLEAMTRVEGQVVFYGAAAGRYTYDDPKRQSGVFTAAILDGLQCQAGTNGQGFVTVDTLSTYAEAEVRSWVRKHKDPTVRNAIQVNMDGETKTMPLAACSGRVAVASVLDAITTEHLATVKTSGSTLQAFGEHGNLLWQHDLQGVIERAEVTDLDGNGTNEVILGMDQRIVVFGAGGKEAWSAEAIRTYLVANLFRKPTRQIVALSGSNLSIYDGAGKIVGIYRHPGPLHHVIVGATTARHAPKIIVAGVNEESHSHLNVDGPMASVFMLDPKKIRSDAHLWYGVVQSARQTVSHLEFVDHDNDGRRDIAVSTSTGGVFYLDFDGKIIALGPATKGGAQFGLIATR